MTTIDYLQQTADERSYVVFYIEGKSGALTFNSVGDLGMEVKKYTEKELVPFENLEINIDGDLSPWIEASLFGKDNKFVATVRAMKIYGAL